MLLPLIHLNFILPHRPFWWPILRIWACTRSIEAFEKLYKIQFHLNPRLEFSSKYEEITTETIDLGKTSRLSANFDAFTEKHPCVCKCLSETE